MQQHGAVPEVPDSNFWHLLGMSVEKREKGKASVILPVSDQLRQLYKVVHGGAIATLIDSAIGVAANSLLAPGKRATTVEMNVNYLMPVASGQLTGTATILQQGKRIIVGTADVHDDQGRLVACGRATFIVSQAPGGGNGV